MGYREVKILVKVKDFEEAEEKALEVFGNEGKYLSDNYKLKILDDCSESLAGYEALQNKEFLELFKQQYEDFYDIIVPLYFGKLIKIDSSLDDISKIRNSFSLKIKNYFSDHITQKVLIYDGEDFCPMLSKEKLLQKPNEYFIVTILYNI